MNVVYKMQMVLTNLQQPDHICSRWPAAQSEYGTKMQPAICMLNAAEQGVKSIRTSIVRLVL